MEKAKNMKKRALTVVQIIAFLLVFVLLDRLVGAGLVYFTYAEKPDANTLVWNDFYQQKKDSIDVLFLGSSHAKFAFNTKMLDENLQKKTFNLASSDQTPVVGYYALKEALKYQKPKVLVYDAYWRKFGTEDNTTPAYFVYDYIKGVDTKVGMLSSLYGDQNFYPFLEEALSKTYKYRENFRQISKSLLQRGKLYQNPYFLRKTNQNPVNYGAMQYEANGYYSTRQVVSTDMLVRNNSFRTAKFSWNPKQIAYFEKMVELCKENGVKMVVITAPLPAQSIRFTKDYAEYSQKIAQLCEENGVEYTDYNKLNDEKLLFNSSSFMDTNHLNSKGAEILDKLVAEKLKDYIA